MESGLREQNFCGSSLTATSRGHIAPPGASAPQLAPTHAMGTAARQLERIGGSAVWASREELWGPRRKGKKKKRGSFAHYSDTVNVPH